MKVIHPMWRDQTKTAPKQMNWDLTASVQTGKQMFNRMSGEQGLLILWLESVGYEFSMETMSRRCQKAPTPFSMIYRGGSKQAPVPPQAKAVS